MAKRLPYGISNFGKVITEDYIYIDKTRFIELLEKESNSSQFFIRPRKFGKSLFFSTLCHYYDVNRAAGFDRLFGGLYIGQHPTPNRNAYMVLQLDFSGLNTSTKDEFIVDFRRKVENKVIDFLIEYRNLVPEAEGLIGEIKETQPGIAAVDIAYATAAVAGRKIFVIIDEYDHFANDLIAIGVDDVYKEVVRANGVVRDFYERLKEGTKTVVDRIFITGISPVMLDDLTSGFNIAANLTVEERYNEMMGFTEEEMQGVMQEAGVDTSLINIDMKAYYNGYLFSRYATKRLYNPSMMVYFFNQLVTNRRIPDNVIDDNLKTDYGRLERLTQSDRNRVKLMEIVKDGGVSAEIHTKFSIDNLFDNEYFVSLLFYMGLLTIDSVRFNLTRLRIPNYSIETVFWEYLLRLTRNSSLDVVVDGTDMHRAIETMATGGTPNQFLDYVSQNIFARLSNRDLENFDEKYIKVILLSCLFQSRIYVPRSEYEVQEGFTDIYLKRSPLVPEVEYEWLWEIKYVKESQRKDLPKIRQQAQQQIIRYMTDREMTNRNDLKPAAIIFIGKRKYEAIYEF